MMGKPERPIVCSQLDMCWMHAPLRKKAQSFTLYFAWKYDFMGLDSHLLFMVISYNLLTFG